MPQILPHGDSLRSKMPKIMPREFAQGRLAVQIGAFEIRRTVGKALRAVKVFVELQLVSPFRPEK
jgi:hypothetical protein